MMIQGTLRTQRISVRSMRNLFKSIKNRSKHFMSNQKMRIRKIFQEFLESIVLIKSGRLWVELSATLEFISKISVKINQ